MKIINLILIYFILLPIFSVKAQDTLVFKGQFSNFVLYNYETVLPIWLNSRYIPQLNYSNKLNNKKKLDIEASANMHVSLATNFTDSFYYQGNIKPYRLWLRYSGKQFELRAGLQKINFGSATMLRPLMWFDGMDTRDPLSLTNGVYALLGRYYFLNNANVWLWALYGNKEIRGWDIIEHNNKIPEFGGRFQLPVGGNSEMGFTYHYSTLNSSSLVGILPSFNKIQEHKFAYDIKIDWLVGLCLETSYVLKNKDLGVLKNQKFITSGIDYTFGVGAGIYTAVEHLLVASDEKAFEFMQVINFTAFSASYPIGVFDNIGLMLYYYWANESVYSFINWQKQFNKTSLHLMAFWNPENSMLPSQNSEVNLYGGKGVQLMFVYNH